MAISTHHSAKPKRKCPIASRRALNVYRPVALRLVSRYGIAISPTMINVGIATPAIHGSK